MATLETTPVEICFFKQGSVEETDFKDQAPNLDAGIRLVNARFPQAQFVRCCQHEPDGGCVFVYPSADALSLDEADASQAEKRECLPEGYGRWIGIISSAAREEPTCRRPAAHDPKAPDESL